MIFLSARMQNVPETPSSSRRVNNHPVKLLPGGSYFSKWILWINDNFKNLISSYLEKKLLDNL